MNYAPRNRPILSYANLLISTAIAALAIWNALQTYNITPPDPSFGYQAKSALHNFVGDWYSKFTLLFSWTLFPMLCVGYNISLIIDFPHINSRLENIRSQIRSAQTRADKFNYRFLARFDPFAKSMSMSAVYFGTICTLMCIFTLIKQFEICNVVVRFFNVSGN